MVLSLLALALPVVAQAPAADGVFVAVGYGGRRMASADGVKWEALTEWAPGGGDDSNNLMSVAYGRGKFVAVGGGGWSRETQAGHILVSTDGRAWREVMKAPNRINPVVFDGKRFVVGSGHDRSLWWSEDGESWTRGAKVPWEGWAFWFRKGASSGGGGTSVMIGNADPKQTTHWAAVTRDGGATLAHFAKDLPPVRDIAYGAGRFVAVGPDGLRMSSRDGVTWGDRADAPGEKLDRVVWTGKGFLATGGGVAYTSPDGVAWAKSEARVPCSPLYATERVWVGTSWPGNMWHSSDGTAWTRGAKLPPNGINAVAYGPPAK